jgi:hypothetical protein
VVVVSSPRFTAGKVSNADAVAAALINMVYMRLGPRQNVVQGVDTRDPAQRNYAHTLLRSKGISPESVTDTPLLYSVQEGVFTKPGMVSLQLTLDIVSQIEQRAPSPDVMPVLLAFPRRHDLEFLPGWAAALEAAEAPEQRIMTTSPELAEKLQGRVFSKNERGAVNMLDILGKEPHAPAVSSMPRAMPAQDFAAGMDGTMDISVTQSIPQPGARRVTISHVVGSGGDHGQPELRQTVMEEADPMMAGGPQAAVPGIDPGVVIDIEARMFERLPQIRGVKENQSLSERDLVIRAQGGTDEDATRREIQRVRMERARTRMARGGGGGGGGSEMMAAE